MRFAFDRLANSKTPSLFETIMNRFSVFQIHRPRVGMQEIAKRKWLIIRDFDRGLHTGSSTHPAIFANMPIRRVARIVGMVEVSDTFLDDLTTGTSRYSNRA